MAAKSKSNRISGLAGGGCLLFFALFWSVGTLGVDVVIARSLFQQIQALSYSTTPGSITHSEVETVRGNRSRTYRPNIQYKYSVDGKEYLGERYRYGQMSSSKGWAEQIIDSHPVGSPIEVHFAPADPSDAVLMVGLEGLDLLIFMFMLPFNLVMLTFWIAGGGAAFTGCFLRQQVGQRCLTMAGMSGCGYRCGNRFTQDSLLPGAWRLSAFS